MQAEFHTSNRCTDFVNEMLTSTSINLLNDIKKIVETSASKQEIINYLHVLGSEFEEKPNSKPNFRYHEIPYGVAIHDNMEIKKSLFLIDIFDLLQPYLNNPTLKSMIDANYCSNDPQILESFFDGYFYKSQPTADCNCKIIYLSIYADEINLINPIGNFIFNST